MPPKINLIEKIGWSIKPIQKVFKFSLSIAFTAGIWVLITQTDKIILSGILSLDEYGYFSLAVVAASAITFLSSPVGTVIMPRLARLHAENKTVELKDLYRYGTQLVSVVTGAATLILCLNAEQILLLWTGNMEVVERGSNVLRLYALGYGFIAVGAFPYYLQFAYGNLRLHIIGNILILILLIPLVIFLSYNYGAIGAGYAWLLIHSAYLIIWAWYVHFKFIPKFHHIWLLNDILKPYASMFIVTILFSHLISEIDNRLFLFSSFFVCTFLFCQLAICQ